MKSWIEAAVIFHEFFQAPCESWASFSMAIHSVGKDGAGADSMSLLPGMLFRSSLQNINALSKAQVYFLAPTART